MPDPVIVETTGTLVSHLVSLAAGAVSALIGKWLWGKRRPKTDEDKMVLDKDAVPLSKRARTPRIKSKQ